MMQYDFQDDGPRRDYTEHNFGMTFQNLTPKPSQKVCKQPATSIQ